MPTQRCSYRSCSWPVFILLALITAASDHVMRTAAACCSSSDFGVYREARDGASLPLPRPFRSDFYGADVAPQLPVNRRRKSKTRLLARVCCVVFGVKGKRPFFPVSGPRSLLSNHQARVVFDRASPERPPSPHRLPPSDAAVASACWKWRLTPAVLNL